MPHLLLEKGDHLGLVEQVRLRLLTFEDIIRTLFFRLRRARIDDLWRGCVQKDSVAGVGRGSLNRLARHVLLEQHTGSRLAHQGLFEFAGNWGCVLGKDRSLLLGVGLLRRTHVGGNAHFVVSSDLRVRLPRRDQLARKSIQRHFVGV